MTRLPAGVAGAGLVFLLFPLAHAVVQTCFDWQVAEAAGAIFLILGLGLALGSLKVTTDSTRAVMGLLAGFLLWAVVGEIPHQTGHGLHVGPDQWGLLLVIGLYYLVSETTPRRQGIRIAFEFFLIVWALHVLLLTAYYDLRFGVTSWLTYAIFVAVVVLTPVLARRLVRIADLTQGIRAGVVAASLLWTVVEILMKWGLLPKPWKPMNLWAVAGCGLALIAWWRWTVASASAPGPRGAARRPRRG